MLSAAVLLLLQTFCKENNIETVENKGADGRLERWQRDKKDFSKEGLYQRFDPDGALAEEAHYTHDTLHGEHKYFYKDGSVESVERYRMGVYHGKYQKYSEDGTLLLEQDFVDGMMQGFSMAYYPNGMLKEKVTMRGNEEDGPFWEYYENGKISAEGAYSPGEEAPLEQGELKEYDETGTLVRIADCKDGVCLTRWKKE
jgi:antitoxin component YwqK of YwqJK toxin-antitoxin module